MQVKISAATAKCQDVISGSSAGSDAEEEKFMEEIFKKLALSARMHDRILKVARTTADLAEEEKIRLADLCEAVS